MPEINQPVRGEKPVLAMDVDGVFILYTDGFTVPEGYMELPDSQPGTRYNPAHGEWIAGLLPKFDAYYMTSHYGGAHEHIGQYLDLPELSWINFNYFNDHPDNKGLLNDKRRLALENFFPGRPIAWIEDELKKTEFEWAEQRTKAGTPTLAIKPNTELGLQIEQVDEIQRWTGSLLTK